MKAYFVQLTNSLFDKKQVLISGAVFAENEEEAEKKAIKIASDYEIIKKMGVELSIYTLIELTDRRPAQFRVEHKGE